jgi:cyanophycin synthetase
MKIRRVLALGGPNLWAYFPVLEAWVDIGRFEDFPSNKIEGFNDRLMVRLPSLVEHRCSLPERGGFFARLREGTYLGHVLEHVALELESLAGTPVGWGRTRQTSERGVYKVVIRYANETLARACLDAAHAFVQAAVEGREFDVAGELGRLRELGDRVCLGPSTQAIVSAARQRGIPHLRLSSGNLVQLGYGSAQRRIWTAESDATSAVAESVAQDKELTRRLLGAVGVPVPDGRVVDSPSDAWVAAQEVDLPVVVKPRDGNHGRGVSINLGDRDAIMAAYGYAEAEGDGVVVERFIRGAQHRLLVVQGRVVAACRGESDQIVGDGVHTIEELVDELNRDPLRGEEEVCPLTPIVFDEIALALLRQQGFGTGSIPAPGKTVVVLRNGDFTVDETDVVHPEVAARAVLAARTVGLDLAGIDIIARDIRRPLEEQAGAVVEVNASPGLLPHLKPLVGLPRPVGQAIVGGLFRPEQDGRIPVVAVTGTNGKSSVVALLGAMLEAAGRRAGLASSDGLRVGERRLAGRDSADASGARSILMNPFVEAAVLEVSASSMLDEGLGFDRCQVAVVTNLGSGDHLGRQYVDSLATMTRVKRGPIDAVLPTGAVVLNADDPAVAAFGSRCDGEVILFGRAAENPLLADHCRAGGRAVLVENDTLTLQGPAGRRPLLGVSSIPHVHQGRVAFQLENVLGAVGAAWALGLPEAAIAAELRRSPGEEGARRFAVIERAGAEVVLSLCRNASGLEATVNALDALFTAASRSVIYAPRVDWRPADALEQGRMLGTAFDRVTVLVGAEVAAVSGGVLGAELARGAVMGGRAAVRQWPGSLELAVDSELAELGPGGLLLVQASGPAELSALHAQILQTGVGFASNQA